MHSFNAVERKIRETNQSCGLTRRLLKGIENPRQNCFLWCCGPVGAVFKRRTKRVQITRVFKGRQMRCTLDKQGITARQRAKSVHYCKWAAATKHSRFRSDFFHGPALKFLTARPGNSFQLCEHRNRMT